ncbi:MAG: tryptophan--tRNA ligase [Verrucomicrobia bacterium]|nr:tryptophan--tRNA ligase [Verrucomicrobiota bacterium]MCG2678798.1 tryptophan--tRNA ligase [Kiritimatiellia bacterium]MBU4246996.1 tryptophan--tRNA ligase [Verrucomicrobiota bacterium]MBU4291869.1 tryptophan--tRNA ligase [Verrucomicrobiota bacterium]MBU4427834.1 tryptophan--tRNA ligase [Verrucomicrobiota bacterium]
MRVLSGIQPSGKLHLGNYFGMMKPALALQERSEAFLFIADYHALTSVSDPGILRQATRDVALDFLACGLNPEKTVFYRQSDVPEVLELTWLLSIVTPMGLLERCHSYKDKVARGIPASHGLFTYPVLMAADILAVQSDVVPVGQDQKQHVEVTRDIAIKFNQKFGEVFKIPEPAIHQSVAVVPGVDGQKMSKSYNNTIELFGAPAETKKAIMRIVTDSKTVADKKDPDQCNVFALYKLFATEAEAGAMAGRYRAGGLGYGEVKKALWERMQAHFEPLRKEREALQQEPGRVDRILRQGAARARDEIQKTLKAARRAVGLE